MIKRRTFLKLLGLAGIPLGEKPEKFPPLRSFCPPDGIVLDPFCGSGTTLAVAEKSGRRWSGIDIRKDQVELSNKRIREAKQVEKCLF